MKHRFMDLVLINGFGSGILIGLFTTGKVKYGLIHGLVMVSAAMVFFMVMSSFDRTIVQLLFNMFFLRSRGHAHPTVFLNDPHT